MLYETLLQGQIFLCLIWFGILSGIIYEIKRMIEITFLNLKIIVFILNIIYLFIAGIIFIFAINLINFGEFRVFEIIAFITGIIIERKICGILVVNFINKMYNVFIKTIKRIFNSNFIKKIFCKRKKENYGSKKRENKQTN